MYNDKEGNESTKNVDDTNPVTTTNSGSYNVANELPPDLSASSVEEKFISKMFSFSRESVCIFVAVTFSIVIAALHSSPPKISKPPPARPFFNQTSMVIDFYKGQLGAMIDRASDSDISFVMYYAPWDAESQILRREFERVSVYYHSKMFFAAINCWHPGSECRKQYNKIQSFPILVLYPIKGSGIQYKGINEAPYIMRFLEGFLNPIKRVSNRKDLMNLLVENDSVLVGFFDFKGLAVSPGYREFYKCAIQALERDPNRDVTFAVVTNAEAAAYEFDIQHTPAAGLYLWNESLIYPQDKVWSADNIIQWMEESIHKVAVWLQPPGIKSSTIAPYLSNGPVLILFTPRNPFHSSNYNYDLLREIALYYYSCGEVLPPDKLIDNLRKKRRKTAERYKQKIKYCTGILSESKTLPTIFPVSVSIQQWINESCCAKIFMNKCLLCKSDILSENKVCNIDTSRPLPEICKKKDVFKMINYNRDNMEDGNYCCDSFYNEDSHDSSYDRSTKKFLTSMIKHDDDIRSPLSIHKRLIEDDCVRILAGNKYHYPIFPDDSSSHDNSKENVTLTASACDVNRTLAFITIDSLHYFHFSEGLGIDVLKMRDKTAAVILDSEQESQYLMQQNLSLNNLIIFINKFTNGSLQRTLRSDRSKRYARDSHSKPKCPDKQPHTESSICIPELNTQNFLATILNPTKDVIVMYHSPYCAFCSAISYVYLTVAHLLSQVNDLQFVRIDGDNNDLPWEYTMSRYPSILFFPAKRKDDSTIFPTSLPITIPNLLNYILANLESDKHIEALIDVCHVGAGEAPELCVARIRRVCLDTIQHLLINYRKLHREQMLVTNQSKVFGKKCREILMKLEHVRDIHLLLGSIKNLESDDKYQIIRERFNNYFNMLKKSIEINNYHNNNNHTDVNDNNNHHYSSSHKKIDDDDKIDERIIIKDEL